MILKKDSTLLVNWFLNFFPTFSTFIDFTTFVPPTRLFPPLPLFVRWEYFFLNCKYNYCGLCRRWILDSWIRFLKRKSILVDSIIGRTVRRGCGDRRGLFWSNFNRNWNVKYVYWMEAICIKLYMQKSCHLYFLQTIKSYSSLELWNLKLIFKTRTEIKIVLFWHVLSI